LATGVFYGLIVRKLGGSTDSLDGARQIVVAARNLDRGTVLKDADLKIVPEPAGRTVPGATARLDEVAGLTVLEAIADNQPVLLARLSPRQAAGGASQAIPQGMRAVSAHIWDSSSVVAMLRSGDRVDLQMITSRGTPAGPEQELRSIMQNVEVLHTAPAEPIGAHAGRPVVTLLVTAPQAEVIGLADTSGRLRVALRNRADDTRLLSTRLTTTALLERSWSVPTATPAPMRDKATPASTPATPARAEKPVNRRTVQLHVTLVQAGAEAATELGLEAKATALRVAALPDGANLEKLVRRLAGASGLAILSQTELEAGHRREVSLTMDSRKRGVKSALAGAAGVRIRFLPSIGSDGALRLRVHPEITIPTDGGTSMRGIRTDLDLRDGQSFVVSGLLQRRDGESLLPRLFPAQQAGESERQLLVLVTPKLRGPVETAALGKGR
jgi:Flp pilus assembly protein CpaB